MSAVLRAVRTRLGHPRRPAPGGRTAVPTVLQMEAVECGAASLAMIMGHHGKRVPLDEVRLACGVSRDGSKASNILKAARGYGMVAKGFKTEPQELRRMRTPAILHWNFAHFVVLEGFRRDAAYINDPSHGPRTLTLQELDEAFTGVVLTFEPGPDFERGGERRGMAGSLHRRLSGSLGAVGYVILAGLALVVPGLMAPTFTRIFVDDVLVKGMTDWIRPLLAVMALTALGMAVLASLQRRYLLRLETKLALATSARFFWHVLHLPMRFFTQRFPGEIASRVAINDRVAQLLSGELATTFISLVVISFFAVLMYQYDPGLTLLAVVTAALNVVALRYVARRRADMHLRMVQDRGKAVGTAMGGLVGIENLKASGSEPDFFARWSGYYAKSVNTAQEIAVEDQVLSAVPPLLVMLSTALLLGIGGMRVMDGHMTMGMLIAFHALMLAFLAPVGSLVSLGTTVQEIAGDMERLDDVLRTEVDTPPEPEPEDGTEGATIPFKLSGRLELRRVSFGYSRLEPALVQSFDLTLRPGSRVALVGGSGCGKSTIARLVSGLYEPWAGEILMDGIPRARIPRSVLLHSFSMVDQDIFLFEGTVAENLTMWDSTVPEADIVAAARDASIHDEITARAGGYAAKVEEGGRNFSGGQRQRLEIARALVNNPTLVVLDEATSALDPSTEKEIDDNLRRRGCTCLIIAHRLSTIRDCDEIIVLEGGRVAQRGTHDTLKAEPGLYAQLIAVE
jgi:NHLM bacteriocin system ABC transporter peptidase/ATP-binding protein